MKRTHRAGWLLMGSSIALFAAAASCCALRSEVPVAMDELALIRSAEPVTGVVTGSGMHQSEGGEDLDRWWIKYSYEVNGDAFSGEYTDYTDWHVPERYRSAGAPVALEYARGDPSISRPQGTGRGSLASWMALRLSGILMIILVSLVFILAGFFICFFQFFPFPSVAASLPAP